MSRVRAIEIQDEPTSSTVVVWIQLTTLMPVTCTTRLDSVEEDLLPEPEAGQGRNQTTAQHVEELHRRHESHTWMRLL